MLQYKHLRREPSTSVKQYSTTTWKQGKCSILGTFIKTRCKTWTDSRWHRESRDTSVETNLQLDKQLDYMHDALPHKYYPVIDCIIWAVRPGSSSFHEDFSKSPHLRKCWRASKAQVIYGEETVERLKSSKNGSMHSRNSYFSRNSSIKQERA